MRMPWPNWGPRAKNKQGQKQINDKILNCSRGPPIKYFKSKRNCK